MSPIVEAANMREREKDLIDRWFGSAGQSEIGLLDLIVLDQWITQLAPDKDSGCPE